MTLLLLLLHGCLSSVVALL